MANTVIMPQISRKARAGLAKDLVFAGMPFRSYAKTLKDVSGCGNDMTIQGSTMLGASIGSHKVLGPTYQTSTSSRWYRGTAGELSLRHSGAWSFSIWLKPNTLAMANDGYFWTYRNYATHYPINMFMTKTSGYANITVYRSSGTTSKTIQSTKTLVAGEWTCLGFRFVPSTSLDIFWNGVLHASNTTSMFSDIDVWTDIAMNLGSPGNDTFSWDGWIAHPYAWKRALRDGEFKALYTDPFALFRHDVVSIFKPDFFPTIQPRRVAFNRQYPPHSTQW